mmetsp:Transcript_14834/g.18566  ORF Transcript_14834/g.18566 Transcript_14834/m.18566 type:complete len:260 (-) Transcript_14834:425-1204(-)|eukprot:CAMPEP_0170454352 /NCGR_PEP_ID=MMETSP0123-20130129/2634_1 /TAXON_ID=182087 /ORGANISM="Favella ehrenbergii, Strain Fehren 1" /LENGTH=259 /DNA_ID=CAMNT_0010717039 /DNA_START=2616 /DNA_END=3395 /DNA_ORIENTATION=-
MLVERSILSPSAEGLRPSIHVLHSLHLRLGFIVFIKAASFDQSVSVLLRRQVEFGSHEGTRHTRHTVRYVNVFNRTESHGVDNDQHQACDKVVSRGSAQRSEVLNPVLMLDDLLDAQGFSHKIFLVITFEIVPVYVACVLDCLDRARHGNHVVGEHLCAIPDDVLVDPSFELARLEHHVCELVRLVQPAQIVRQSFTVLHYVEIFALKAVVETDDQEAYELLRRAHIEHACRLRIHSELLRDLTESIPAETVDCREVVP